VGDFVLLYTDGVTEAMDAERRMFGEERLRRFLGDHCRAKTEHMATALEEELTTFTGAAAPSDDITFVIARRV
jgi:sigma-B regulation protein RsbU (phosphoserine phosphatase)